MLNYINIHQDKYYKTNHSELGQLTETTEEHKANFTSKNLKLSLSIITFQMQVNCQKRKL